MAKHLSTVEDFNMSCDEIQPPLPEQDTQHSFPLTNQHESSWPYTAAEFIDPRHMLLPEPLPIPKSILYDHEKKKKIHQNFIRPPVSLRSRNGRFVSLSTSPHAGPTVSERKFSCSRVSLKIESQSSRVHKSRRGQRRRGLSPSELDRRKRIESSDEMRFNHGRLNLNQDPADSVAMEIRPPSPAQSTSSNSSHSTTDFMHTVRHRLEFRRTVKSAPLGQVRFQCARCSLIFPTLNLLEKHIGQVHIRMPDGEGPFQLTEDNFHSMVRHAFDFDFNYGVYVGCSGRYSPEPVTAIMQEEMDISRTTQELFADAQTRTKGSFSHDEPTSHQSMVYAGISRGTSQGLVETAQVYSDAVVKEVSRTPTDMPITHRHTGPLEEISAGGMAMMEAFNAVKTPVSSGNAKKSGCKPKNGKKGKRGEKGKKGRTDMAANKTPLRKCRGVYGIDNQDRWCNMCKWKKGCTRFSNSDKRSANLDG